MNFKKLIGLVLVLCISVLAFSGCGATGAATDASAGAGMGSSLIMMVAMVAIFYFLLIRPENKRKKKAQEMRDSISVGDKITTIIGKVVHVADDRITFETGEDRVRLEVTKWAVSSNEGRGADKETTDSEETIAQ